MQIKNGSPRFGFNMTISGEQVRLKREKEIAKGSTITVEFVAELEGELYTGYPAPPCSNPDHPNYSDPGCGPEGDFCVVGVEQIEICVMSESTLTADDRKLLDTIELGNEVSDWLSELFCHRYGMDLRELTSEEYRQAEDDLCDRCTNDNDRY